LQSLKIGQHLAKRLTKVSWRVLWPTVHNGGSMAKGDKWHFWPKWPFGTVRFVSLCWLYLLLFAV